MARMETWVILITDGTVIEYPPEAYDSVEHARSEAKRWAWILSDAGGLSVEMLDEDRWSVGNRDIRLVLAEGSGTWVGTFWTWHGYPEPEALLLGSRREARSWAVSPLLGSLEPSSIDENEWTVSATFEQWGEEAYAVAHRLKWVDASWGQAF